MMNSFINRVLELAISIQQVPAPTFHEAGRAEFVRQCFQAEPGLLVEMDPAGNVLACLPGSGNSSGLVVSAHLDTVFPMDTNLRVHREVDRVFGAGIGDNALGVAGLFGLVWLLSERDIHLGRDLCLVANVCEEGLGDLKGMRAVLDRFGDVPQAYLILEGLALGQIYHRGLGVRRYRITISTSGGHSWTDYGQPSAVHELAGLATRLTSLTMPANPRTTLNVGKISGGTSVNTIAAEAHLELDLRSESYAALQEVSQKVEKIATSLNRPDVRVQLELIGQRPVGEISDQHPLVLQAKSCLLDQGIRPILNIGSTDANLPLSMGLPAVTIGLTQGASAHTVHEYILIDPLEKGFEQLLQLVQRIGLSS
jgi:tripeptide aminopeptidase